MSVLKLPLSSMAEALAEVLPELPPLGESAILRIPVVLQLRGRSRSAHYQDIDDRLFTRPIPIGGRAVGHAAIDLVVLNFARIARKTDDEIRALVEQLEAAHEGMFEGGA